MPAEGKVAIVTGAGRGIGAGIAARLAADGMRIVLADLDHAAAAETAHKLAGEALAVRCDVSAEADVVACAGQAMERFGRIDVVVNNAGLMTFKALDQWTAQDWLRVLSVDLVGAAMFTREAFRRMGEGGAIINVSSVHAVRTTPQAAPYAAAKAGLLSLTRSAAIEGRERGIRANAVLPGAIDTAMLWSNSNVRSGVETIDRADVGAAADIAGAVAFLAGDEARFITGASLAVDGGRLARL